MADKSSLILSTVENKIQKVVINRPIKKNAMSLSIFQELTKLLNESAKNEEVLIFVLTGTGDFFSSGVDLNVTSIEFSPTIIQDSNTIYKTFVDALIMYPKLLVAIVNGPAIGLACTILGLFDMVYASDKAYFCTPFSSLGLLAEGCSTYIFPRLLGSKAGDMLYMGYQMSAHEAQQYGLVSQVYNHDALEKVWDYLNKVSTLSSESILATKRLITKWNRETLLKVNAEEAKELKKRWESPDLLERFLSFLTRKSKM